MSKVTPVPFGGPQAYKGEFKVKAFNLFDEGEAAEYALLRQKANSAGTGIKLEHIKEFVRKRIETSSEGEERTRVETEDLFMLVQWWDLTPRKEKGENDDDAVEARKEWSEERPAGTGER